MKRSILVAIATLALGVAASAAQAGSDHRGDRRHDRDNDRGYARVVDVKPIYEQVRYRVPVQHCWDERREYRGRNGGDAGAAIVGGVAGAMIGNAIGRGENRAAATVGGAVAGAIIASELADDGHRHRGRYEVVRRCETRHEERWDRRVAGYRVTYVYDGRRATTRLAYDPGKRLRLSDARRWG